MRGFESQVRRRDGTVIWVEDTARAVRDTDGRTLYYEGSLEDITERVRAEEVLRERRPELGERVKELNCLFDISALVEKPDVSLAEILQGAADVIPPAWQCPEITGARIILEDQEFTSESFRETIWQQASDIVVRGERIGTLDVCYLEERPESDEGPFLKEERSLLNAIAERLGRIAERERAEPELFCCVYSGDPATPEGPDPTCLEIMPLPVPVPPIPVGGYIVPVNKVELLALRLPLRLRSGQGSGQATWLGLAALMVVAVAAVVVRRRKA